jgi:hypothetical protein
MAQVAYPKVSKGAWITLRARAASAPSTKFTPSTVAAMLGMASADSARDNVVTPMKRLGLLDDDGALTPRGHKWRIDSTYPAACDEIIKDVYPDDLAALQSQDGAPDSNQVKTWFDHRGFGESNARNMAATYVLIASKQIPGPPASDSRKAATAKKSSAPKAPAGARPAQEVTPAKAATPAPPSGQGSPGDGKTAGVGPKVHLDIQIHIPADATPEQIDQIFASMGKHLYGRDERA